MQNIDQLIYIYAAHALFWGAFGVALTIRRRLNRAVLATPASGNAAPVAQPGEVTAPYSRAALVVHICAFALMYLGINATLASGSPGNYFRAQGVVGALLIAYGAALAVWAVLHFASWRFRAKLGEGHQLATGGPFRFIRNPIYLGLNFLALGTAVWLPSLLLWIACLLMFAGSDIRARAEEGVLKLRFGAEYMTYQARTRRFIPGIY